MATNQRKTVRPAVLAMQRDSMAILISRIGIARATPRTGGGKSAPVVLRTKMRVAANGPNGDAK
ncbi:hypothetical protein [Ralstonia pseudosolanacearum]|uniref:hypothetical protein n=1 Tax=Ralstonia pseudosolanacearum TaxID=1310165 RepID=UPI003CEB684B